MQTFHSSSEQDTYKIAAEFAKTLKSGDVVALFGDLGAGKTAFVRGVADALGAGADKVSSPTFTLVNEYDGDLKIFHFDVYRLENARLSEFDWMDEYLFSDEVCLIEWAEYILPILPKSYIRVEIERISENERKITMRRELA
ncbi:MAG: tRNA (adenosine(37)-N6)-threonylcarbamoyltransferase complex ATPase subunit type 1 TsaE [Oscillospiraceae bacterium]|nr:tRNA (adenosine(37)-N6)-threonylcarbamoyltransferase complex ATPase subunit type 1 TsaE [Oscillospiraceae bacterium]